MQAPKISQKIHQQRRQNLFNSLPKNSLVIISSGELKQRNGDVFYPFRACSNFLYLIGLNEPNTVAVFDQGVFSIFLADRTPIQTIWQGKSLGCSGALSKLKADKAYPIETLDEYLGGLLVDKTCVAYDVNNTDVDISIKQNIEGLKSAKKGTNTPSQFYDILPIIHQARLIKDAAEITLMQHAADISIKAHNQAMQVCKVGDYEYQIAAVFDGVFRANNAKTAYPHIVASGVNTCTLHYVDNNQILKDGDLLLIDAGAEFEGYASDITRTFPVNGFFSPEQKAIYQLVLEAQKTAINCIKPSISINTPHKITCDIIIKGLRKLGLLSADSDDTALKQFFMHGTGHWLGLDVHDVGTYKIDNKHKTYQAGMITTIEPGIYIAPNKDIDPKWWGIGVRIEDDILVTKDGHKNLSQNLVKEIDEIEQLMKTNSNYEY